jgi:hypothetical protein
VIDEYGVMVEWWLAGDNQRTLKKFCSNATLSTTKQQDLGLCGEKPAPSCLSYDMDISKIINWKDIRKYLLFQTKQKCVLQPAKEMV